jgi:hypothetical protein
MANLLFAPENLTRSGLKTPEGVSLHAGWYDLPDLLARFLVLRSAVEFAVDEQPPAEDCGYC